MYHSSTPTLLQLLPEQVTEIANTSQPQISQPHPLPGQPPIFERGTGAHPLLETSSGIPYTNLTRSFQKLHNGNDRPRFRSTPHQRHSSKLLRLCESTSPLRAGQFILCLPKFPMNMRKSAYSCLSQKVIRLANLPSFVGLDAVAAVVTPS